MREKTHIRYARAITSTGNFELQDPLYRFNPSVYHVMNLKRMFRMGEEFLRLKPKTPQLFYVWGHSYEWDQLDAWEQMEEFCRLMSGKDDIFYGTNREVLL